MSTQEFNTLILNNVDGLKPFAVTLTKDQEAAKDLFQETIYKAFAHRDKYKPGTNVRAWLYTIMRNIFINEYRRNGRRKAVLDTVQRTQASTSVSSELSMRLKEINQAIYHLPVVFKTACLLYLDGYKYQEIAYALDEPLGTIKSRIHFAKKMLQKQIDR
jgi:RNA polymerase sigma factor (sigma-70 family)